MAAFRIINGFRKLAINNQAQCLKLSNVYCQQHYLFSSKIDKPAENNEGEKKRKTTPIQKITLVSPDENIQIISYDEAQKISKRRDLKLVKVIDIDTKTQRPIYKLMTGAEYHKEDLKQREAKKEKKEHTLKGEKLLLINARISEHDLESRIKNILKWINKRYEVRVVITGEAANMDTAEKVYGIIEQNVTAESRILQKRTKGIELKFQILPPKPSKQKTEQETEQKVKNSL